MLGVFVVVGEQRCTRTCACRAPIREKRLQRVWRTAAGPRCRGRRGARTRRRRRAPAREPCSSRDSGRRVDQPGGSNRVHTGAGIDGAVSASAASHGGVRRRRRGRQARALIDPAAYRRDLVRRSAAGPERHAIAQTSPGPAPSARLCRVARPDDCAVASAVEHVGVAASDNPPERRSALWQLKHLPANSVCTSCWKSTVGRAAASCGCAYMTTHNAAIHKHIDG